MDFFTQLALYIRMFFVAPGFVDTIFGLYKIVLLYGVLYRVFGSCGWGDFRLVVEQGLGFHNAARVTLWGYHLGPWHEHTYATARLATPTPGLPSFSLPRPYASQLLSRHGQGGAPLFRDLWVSIWCWRVTAWLSARKRSFCGFRGGGGSIFPLRDGSRFYGGGDLVV